MSISIRFSTAEDSAFVYACICLLEDYVFEQQKLEKIFIENSLSPNNLYLIAEVEGKKAGICHTHIQNLVHHCAPVAEIQELFVLEEYRGLKIGQALLQETERLLRERGIKEVEVTSGQRRVQAHAFYLRENYLHSHLKFTKKLD